MVERYDFIVTFGNASASTQDSIFMTSLGASVPIYAVPGEPKADNYSLIYNNAYFIFLNTKATDNSA
jgi:hypothetical protein